MIVAFAHVAAAAEYKFTKALNDVIEHALNLRAEVGVEAV